MEQKAFSFGVLVGRFQPLHIGHIDMINKAVRICSGVGVFIGSSQESGTAKNPLSFELRKEMLERVFGNLVKVHPLPDAGLGNVSLWGEYVLDQILKFYPKLPDLFITGKEARRISWFSGTRGSGIAELQIPKTIDISASELREFLIKGDRTSWERYTPEKIHPMYETIRRNVTSSMNNDISMSI